MNMLGSNKARKKFQGSTGFWMVYKKLGQSPSSMIKARLGSKPDIFGPDPALLLRALAKLYLILLYHLGNCIEQNVVLLIH